jgi:hypothetical protein
MSKLVQEYQKQQVNETGNEVTGKIHGYIAGDMAA